MLDDTMDISTLDNLIEGCQLISFDWRYLYVNDAVLEQSKYQKKEDLLGYTMMEKYPGIEKTELFSVMNECMSKRISQQMENEFTFPDQTSGWFELRMQPVSQGLFILSIDITDRKKAELAKESHIESLEEMMFITSHKLRLPISQIIGAANVLDSTKLSQDDLKKITGYMKKSVQLLDAFTQELTTFIHLQKMKTVE
ncbi:MAG: PAS domain-containing protein [Calditrichaeota bacterium]|nr:PAS domain-containing protein [Calditrichota bacterium]